MNTIRRTIVAVATAAALATALAAPAVAGDTGAPLRSPVGDWRTSTHGVKQTITFTADGQVYGDSGCNRFTGKYTTDGDRISIGPLASTMMACPQRQMDAEATFLTRIQAAVGYTASKKVLKIFAPKDMVRFVRA
jgi:heat shock protein HslJ